MSATVAAGPQFGATDEDRRVALRRMRMLALALLLVAAVIFVLTVNRDGAWAYVHATAEAAMIGAIADCSLSRRCSDIRSGCESHTQRSSPPARGLWLEVCNPS